ncbi:MAG: ferritin-like domain-containing protein [Halomonadaceae bacterium]|nr:MAG: ferritin-like domain-containing protein [Halomonadaceae bacterium]
MSQAQENLDQWLRDAHAMEEQAIKMLDDLVKRIDDYPELNKRIEQHLSETHGQLAKLESCMKRRNISTSSLKDVAGKFTAMMQGMGNLFSSDEVVKGLLASYTFEHMEIASYRILIAAAEEVGDSETLQACKEICSEEEAIAKWLGDNMGKQTREYLLKADAPRETAKI